MPKRNEKDLPEIPEEVRNTLKFHFVSTIDEVMEIALGAEKRLGTKAQKKKVERRAARVRAGK